MGRNYWRWSHQPLIIEEIPSYLPFLFFPFFPSLNCSFRSLPVFHSMRLKYRFLFKHRILWFRYIGHIHCMHVVSILLFCFEEKDFLIQLDSRVLNISSFARSNYMFWIYKVFVEVLLLAYLCVWLLFLLSFFNATVLILIVISQSLRIGLSLDNYLTSILTIFLFQTLFRPHLTPGWYANTHMNIYTHIWVCS